MRKQDALLELLRELQCRDYDFVCVTPATHAIVLSRPAPVKPTLRDIFGWNRAFERGQLESALFDSLDRADCLEEAAQAFRSRVRVATLGSHLFLHSSFPTDFTDAVFFGPDTYRFARFVQAQLPAVDRPGHVVEMGAGSGAVGILAARLEPAAKVTLVDINPAAMELAAINAQAAGAAAVCVLSDRIPAGCDVVLANPPYMMDSAGRAYRDGGSIWGGQLACEWVSQALGSLTPGGTMFLYTGIAIVGGKAPLLDRIGELCRSAGASLQCDEIDPDLFGEELRIPGYSAVERIAAAGIVIRKAAE